MDTTDRVPAIHWCVDGRGDPITGLVAFPDFHARFPDVLAGVLADGGRVGLAIGDVDNLKEYVEGSNGNGSGSFGHLAGFGVMSRLGMVARDWFWDRRPRAGCVSTFGGDEIIAAELVPDEQTFVAQVALLQRQLNRTLPRTVSFAVAVAGPDHLGPLDSGQFYLRTMTTVDRHLFRRKASRRSTTSRTSFLVVADLATGASVDVATSQEVAI